MKGDATVMDLLTKVPTCSNRTKPAGAATDGCPNLKNVTLLKRMQDNVTEIIPELKLVFCIIKQEALC